MTGVAPVGPEKRTCPDSRPVDNDGRTYGLTTLTADQLLRLHFAAVAAAA